MTDRASLARRLFDLKPGDGDTAVGMARAIGTAILDDLISEAKKARRIHGAGFWILNPQDDITIWENEAGLIANIQAAQRGNDGDMEETFRRLLRRLQQLPKGKTLIAIADDRGLRAYELDNDNPAGHLSQILDEATRP